MSQPLSGCRAATLPQQVLVVPPFVVTLWACRVHYRAHNSSSTVLLLSPVPLHAQFNLPFRTSASSKQYLFFWVPNQNVPTREICRTHLVSNNAADNYCALLIYRVVQKKEQFRVSIRKLSVDIQCVSVARKTLKGCDVLHRKWRAAVYCASCRILDSVLYA